MTLVKRKTGKFSNKSGKTMKYDSFSPSALKVYNSLDFANEEEQYDIDLVLAKMTEFCRGVVNETYERYLFNTRSQRDNQSIDEFYSALLALSKNCSFGDLTSSLIKDRVIVGMQNNSARQKLRERQKTSERGLTLEKCLEIARLYEVTRIRMKAMQENGDKDTVNRVHKYKKGNRSRKNQGQSNIENKSEQKGSFKRCCFCGRCRYIEYFQMQIHRVLENQPGVACIMDDMVVYGKDLREHNERLNQVLDRLSKANITLNEGKCEFRKEEISCLGQIVVKNGVKLDPAKISAVVNMEAPQNVSELRHFLGMVNQLGKFLPNLAKSQLWLVWRPRKTSRSYVISWEWLISLESSCPT